MQDLISRQAAIDTLNVGAELLKRVLDDADIVGAERAKYEWGLGLIESYISDMKELPSAQPVAKDINVPVNDLISRQAAIDYCYQLINVEYEQGSDEMNYGQERVNQTETILHHLEIMPSAQPETHDKRTETHACDCISRQAAMEEISKQQTYKMFEGEDTLYLDANDVGSVLASLPSAQPEHTNSCYTNSWCIDCKEYDTENKCCPRYNRVIKKTLDDAYRHGETEAEARFHDEIVRCKDCKHQVKEWRTDKRLKNKGYMVCGCEVVGDACGYWALLGQDDDYCSFAERRTNEGD